ncbi:MAG: sulfatase family protein [Daejeonella sp.]
MSNRHLTIILIAVYQLFTLPASNAQVKPPQRPNIVIILADDLGYGDVSSNNPQARTKTPNIDKMAQTSMVFTDAHSGGAVCTPSRYALVTGRYYFRAPKLPEVWGYLSPRIEQGRETIGSLMQRAGYSTASIGKWHLGLNWKLKDPGKPQFSDNKDKTVTNTDFTQSVSGGPNSLGFDYSFILPASLDMPPYVFVKNNRVVDPEVILTADAYPKTLDTTQPVWDRKYTNENDVYWERGVWWRNGEMSKSFKMEDCFSTVVNEGLSFIKTQTKNNPKKPFMLYLPLTGPHTPWLPDAEFKGKTMLGTYGDFVSQVDDAVGQIMNTLKSLNIDENTMVVFSSDNGGHWAEEDIQAYAHQSNYGRRGQKGDIWDGGHHIPLIIQWPAQIKKKFIYTQTAGLVDLMATFSELTSQPVSKNYGEDSFSFYKALKNHSNTSERDHIIYISSRGNLAIKKGGWKYIEGLGSGGFTEPGKVNPVKGGPSGQLYNVVDDPLERNNLYLQNTAKVKELSELLNKLKAQGFSRVSG